ncbi:MAG TPA: hypothetical protein DGB85_05210 [Deltaproteobacteria bacterium]|nr:hypothetical protein [Deltaproteobacteria bacterium]
MEMQPTTNPESIKVTPPENSKLGDLRWRLDRIRSSIPNRSNLLNQPSGHSVPFLPSKKPNSFLFSAVNHLIFDRSTF